MKKTYWKLLCFAFALIMVSTISTSSALADASITVDVNEESGTVNYTMFGNNIALSDKANDPYNNDYLYGGGVWDPYNNPPRVVPEVLNYAKDSGMTYARFTVNFHDYNWRNMVGPVAGRAVKFGIPEFLKFAQQTGVEPVIMISDYNGDASEAAQLVEYLNGNSGWADQRDIDKAALGLAPGSWHVKWFEYGNETFMGPLNTGEGIRFTAEEYAEKYIAYRNAMRGVNYGLNEEDQIKLGAVIYFPSFIPDRTDNFYKDFLWSEDVIARTGQIADFYIVHKYSFNGWKHYQNLDVFEKSLAESNDQLRDYFIRLNNHILNMTGGRMVPFAITEFNGPWNYYKTLSNSLVVADFIRQMMYADNLLFANFFMFSTSNFAMIAPQNERTYGNPSFNTFQFYKNLFGDELISSRIIGVDSYAAAENSKISLSPADQNETIDEVLDPTPLDGQWTIEEIGGATTVENTDGVTISFDGTEDVDYMHSYMSINVEPDTWYRLSGYIKAEDLQVSATDNYSDGIYLEVLDRGYDDFDHGDLGGWNLCNGCSIIHSGISDVLDMSGTSTASATISTLNTLSITGNNTIETRFQTASDGNWSHSLIVFDYHADPYDSNNDYYKFVMVKGDGECVFGDYDSQFHWRKTFNCNAPFGREPVWHRMKVVIQNGVATLYADIGDSGVYTMQNSYDFNATRAFTEGGKVGLGTRNTHTKFDLFRYSNDCDKEMPRMKCLESHSIIRKIAGTTKVATEANPDYVGYWYVETDFKSKAVADADVSDVGVKVFVMRDAGEGVINGTVRIKDVKLQKLTPARYELVPYLSVNASKSEDGSKVYLMVTNKNMNNPIEATINLQNYIPLSAQAWTLMGVSSDAGASKYMSMNGGFEDGLNNWHQTASAVTTTFYASGTNANVYFENGSAMAVYNDEYIVDDHDTYQTIAVTPYTKYSLGGYIKTDGIETYDPASMTWTEVFTGGIGISATEDSGAEHITNNLITGTTDGWTYLSDEFITGPDTHEILLKLIRKTGGRNIRGTAYWDGVNLIEKGAYVSYDNIGPVSNGFSFTFPKHSLTALEIADEIDNNIIRNSGFEEYEYPNYDIAEWWGIPDFPEFYTRVDNSVSHSGINSIRVDFNNSDKDYLNIHQTASSSLAPYTTYMLEGYIKTDSLVGGGHGVSISIKDESRDKEYFTHALKGNNGWTYVSKEFTTGPDITTAEVHLRRLGDWAQTVSGTAWFDDIKLYNTSDPISHVVAHGNKKRIEIKWRHAAWAMSYNIYRSTSSGGPYELIKENFKKGESKREKKACCKFIDTDVEKNITYYYVVRGVNGLGGESPDSDWASASLQ